jgi:hypothetical protein
MSRPEIEKAAKQWFDLDADKMIEMGYISLDRIVEYFLQRNPWVKNDKVD